MVDVIDSTVAMSEMYDKETEYKLSLIREQYSRESLEECEDCGDDIPEARRLAVQGVSTCIFCQEKRER